MNPDDDIQTAIKTKDNDTLYAALGRVFRGEPTGDIVPALCFLILENWHEQHEDIAQTLQKFKDPRAIDALGKAVWLRLPYLLEWDNYYAFARKCTWALADIGGSKAKEVLVELSNSSDAEIASYARKRIEHWSNELHRKGEK